MEQITQCDEVYEPKPSGYRHSDSYWRRGTHTCKLGAGHELPHVCPVCGGSWSEPGGPVTSAEARTGAARETTGENDD